MNGKTTHRMKWARAVAMLVVFAAIVSACSSSDSGTDASLEIEPSIGESESYPFAGDGPTDGSGSIDAVDTAEIAKITADGSVVFQNLQPTSIDAKVIRDGRLDIRIEEGDFDAKGVELRVIANELGGYLSSGESHIEEYDEARYAVGWFTLRVPSDRFDDAVTRVERLGERVSSSLSSQDVSEEYVDLEGRLSYWKQQEAFYSRLMDEASTIDDLVTLQTRMQDVLLNIEQIEGRLRYLDGRTAFATLTVGLTEVPDVIAPVVPEPVEEPGPIGEAFDQAGEVLLATVAFLIVGAAVVLPLAIIAFFAWLILRLVMPKKKEPAVIEG